MECKKIVRYGRANICGFAKILRWKEIFREGSGGVEKADHSFTLHFCELYHRISLQNPKNRVRFLVDCKSLWIAMERWDDPVQYGETIDYNGRS